MVRSELLWVGSLQVQYMKLRREFCRTALLVFVLFVSFVVKVLC